jgi:glutathione peroxidase-family protein
MDYRGQVVLLDFYHPQLPGWAESLPRLKSVYQEFQGQGFEIIGVPLLAGGKGRVKVPWIQLTSSRGISGSYRVFGDATNFLIDQDGRIAGRNLTPVDLRRKLSGLLKPEL